MCKICKDLKEFNWNNPLDPDIRESFSGDIYMELHNGKPALLQIAENTDPSVYYINYCPFCGRKLTNNLNHE